MNESLETEVEGVDMESGERSRAQYPDEGLPEGSVVEGNALERDVDEAFDYVVIGTGAAGAVAAHTLAKAGFSVAMVEEGPWVKTRQFGKDVFGAFRTLMRDGGSQAIEGRAFMPLLQARCVGGSTVVNSAIAWRVPEDVTDDWAARFGLGDTVTMKALDAHYDALEHDLNVHPTEADVMGRNNGMLLDGFRERGMDAHPIRRYARGCRGSSGCLTGCRTAAKQGMNVSYVPWTLALGARLFASCRVERIVVDGGRATGVVARTVTADGRRPRTVALRARRGVVLAASTIQTPNVLRRSGLRSKIIGKHFQAHPGVGLAGVFDKPVHMEFGTTQGAESAHFRKSDRFKIETIAMQPELLAARMPGAGTELMRRLAEYPNIGVWGVQVRTEAEGTVGSGWGGRDKVKLSLTQSDLMHARKALGVLARLMFEQGAKEIWPGVFGLPSVMRSIDEAKAIDEGPLDARRYGFVATHLFGAARMGPDPRTSAVGLDFSTHEAAGLYVVDSSVFPTNLGVNPQHTIMAVARLAATRIAESAAATAKVA